MGRKSSNLNVVQVMEDFAKHEKTSTHRNGTFKIEAPFEKAIDAILKAKAAPKKS